MGLAIIFRNSLHPNLFNHILIHSISIIGQTNNNIITNMLITSGYFQEIQNRYQATNEIDFCNNVNLYVEKYIILGIHSNIWRDKFRLFCQNFNLKTPNCISRKFLIASGTKWHAKVFTLIDNINKCFGIIGSSNFTSKAFGSRTNSFVYNFNYECDTVIWSDTAPWSNNMNRFIVSQGEEYNSSIIFSNNYNDFGLDIDTRIISLNEQILGQNYLSGIYNSYIRTFMDI